MRRVGRVLNTAARSTAPRREDVLVAVACQLVCLQLQSALLVLRWISFESSSRALARRTSASASPSCHRCQTPTTRRAHQKMSREVDRERRRPGGAEAGSCSYDAVPDEIFLAHVIPRLNVSDRVVLSRVNRRTRALVVREGDSGLQPSTSDFVNSVARIRWARENGCIWDERSSTFAVWEGGPLEVLQWMRRQDPPCDWDECTCSNAAAKGNLEALRWMREQDPPCPFAFHEDAHDSLCAMAADGGHLEVLRWARGLTPPRPWGEDTCESAAREGHLEVLRWAPLNPKP